MMTASAPTIDTEAPLRVGVIIGSTRRGRLGEGIARWFVDQLEAAGEFEIDLIDLAGAELPAVLPDFDESTPDSVSCMGVRLAAADAFVVVTPEYNHSFPASLKHAIDWFYEEWQAKPVAFVSYGGRSGGIRAVEQLRQVFGELRAVTTRDGVAIDTTGMDDGGSPPEGTEVGAKMTITELLWWGEALRAARARRPFGT